MGQLSNTNNPERVGVRCITVINITESSKPSDDLQELNKEESRIYIGDK